MRARRHRLTEREIHVWSLCTRVGKAVGERFEALLGDDEKERAARFHFNHDRQSFIITRGVLRCLLGRYLGMDPSSVQLEYGVQGKPALPAGTPVEFNVSHSGGWAALAFTVGCPVGIDLELIRPMSDMQSLAERFFCPEETAEILAAPGGERERAFFNCWARKEAFIKALGEGLSAPLNGFQVSASPEMPPRVVHVRRDAREAQAWNLHDLQLSSSYVAALAYRGGQRSVLVYQADLAHLADAAGQISPCNTMQPMEDGPEWPA